MIATCRLLKSLNKIHRHVKRSCNVAALECCNVHIHEKMLQTKSGSNTNTTTKITLNNGLHYRTIDDVVRTTNLRIVDSAMYHKISTFLPGELEQRYFTLSDLGFENITVDCIMRYPTIMKMKRFSSELHWDPLESLVSKTDGPEDLKQIILNKYPITADGNLRLLHRVVILEYLLWKLEMTKEEFLTVVRNYPTVGNRSVSGLKETLAILLEVIGFTSDKIKTNGYLLFVNSSNVRDLLLEDMFNAGENVRNFFHKYPRVLSMHIDRVKLTKQYLDEFKISPEQMFSCGLIFSLKPSTLRERLEYLKDIPEFESLKSSSRYLNLVYYFSKAKRRLSIAKHLNITNLNVEFFISSEKNFSAKLDLAAHRRRKHEIVDYLTKKFGMAPTLIYHRIDFSCFPYLTLIPEKIDETVAFLNSRFLKEEIDGNLSVVLFDVNEVKEKLVSVQKRSRTKLNILQDLRVLLEKPLKNLYGKQSEKSKFKYGRKVLNESEKNLSMEKYLVANE